MGQYENNEIVRLQTRLQAALNEKNRLRDENERLSEMTDIMDRAPGNDVVLWLEEHVRRARKLGHNSFAVRTDDIEAIVEECKRLRAERDDRADIDVGK